ncbi:MAG: hypothetical protein ABH836_02925 [Candidatus Omnitrophota bacterium]
MIIFWWMQFAVCAGLIFYVGEKLASCGEEIAEKLSISTALVGFVFLAIVTSLPEVFTAIGSVTLVEVPDFAVSDTFGSILFNLLIIGMLEFQQSKKTRLPILVSVEKGHINTILITNFLLIICAAVIFMRNKFNAGWAFFNIGYETPILIFLYIMGMRIVFSSAIGENVSSGEVVVKKYLWLRFCLAAAVIVASGLWLAKIGKGIVSITGWNETLFGTVFLSIATSLPEVFVSCAALRLGFRSGKVVSGVNMAVANVLGSNFFDVMIIPIADIFYRKKALLSGVSIYNNLTILLILIFGSLIAWGIMAKNKKIFWRFGIEITIMLILALIMGLYFVFAR